MLKPSCCVSSQLLEREKGKQLHRPIICSMSELLTPSTCKLETKSFVGTVLTIIDQNNQALMTLVISVFFFKVGNLGYSI